MSGILDKAAGIANEAIGKIKQGVGSSVGSDQLKREGVVQDLKGDAQQELGEIKAATYEEESDTEADRETKIREHAYYLWIRDGLPEGRQHEHWRQAEKEIDAEERSPNS